MLVTLLLTMLVLSITTAILKQPIRCTLLTLFWKISRKMYLKISVTKPVDAPKKIGFLETVKVRSNFINLLEYFSQMLTASENLNSLENTWANLNTFSTMLRTFYTKGHLNFNQLTSLEETEKFSVASIVLNIHEKLAPMFIRVCEKLFYESWPK